jgi:hypothetical protein
LFGIGLLEPLSPQKRGHVALSSGQKADALMTQPGSITPQQKADLLLHFTRDQIIELTVDVMKWNYQKVPVSLGTDLEVQEGELTPLIFDAQGNWVKPT